MNTKDFLKIAGVKSEKEFYEKFPTEEAFFEAYPQADMYRKGGKLKKKKQDPAHGYREFPPNVMAMGGGIIDMMETGGKLPESVLRPRLEAHMSTQEADSYLSKYKSGGYLPTMMQAGGNINSPQQTGYISPMVEAQYNDDWTQAKEAERRMSAGEEFGYGLLDVIASPVGISGRPLSSYLTNKTGSTGERGSWFGNIESNYLHPIAQGVLKAFPMTAPFAEAGQAINKTVSPMVNADNPQRVATQQSMSAVGDAAGGLVGSFMGATGGMGNSMKKYGGNLKMEIGGPMPSSMGLNELTGPTHEEGGMAISPEVEVEGGETILEPASYVYSDSILVPGTKKTFAQASKAVKNKYKMREDDKLSQEAMNSELEALMNQQEEVKESMMIADTEKFQNKMMAKYGGLMPDMGYPVDRNMQPIEMRKGGGIYIKPSKRGTFTAAAKKRGMGVQEFASKVMANKEDYSSAMVKKANFAKNAAKWKKQFGGFIEDEEMYGPVMMDEGGGIDPITKSMQEYISSMDEKGFDPLTGDPYKGSPSFNYTYRQPSASLDINLPVLTGTEVSTRPEPIDFGPTNVGALPSSYTFSDYLKRNSQNQPITGLKLEGTTPVRTKDYATDMEIAAGLKQGPREFWPEYTPESEDSKKKEKKKFDFNKLRMATTAIGGMAAAAKGLGKQRLYLTPQAAVNYLNTRPAEVLAERQGELALAAGLGGLRDNATTQGNYLANVANLASSLGIGTGSNVANIRFQGDTQNLGTFNQAALQRQATIAANNAARTRKETADLLRRDKMLEDASKIAQTAAMDAEKRKQQEFILTELMRQGVIKREKDGTLMMKSGDTWVPYYSLG